MRRVNLNFVILILLLAVAALFKSRASVSRATASAPPPSAPLLSKAAAVPNTAASPVKDALPPAPVLTVTPKIENKPAPFAKELAKYALLKKKVFLNPSEEQARNALLSDEKILRGLQPRLMRSPATADEAKEQNEAIDMLLDALRSGDREVAIEVLRAVVTDGQVEDESIDRSTRENLAGIKAEVLFQWSALRPSDSGELAGMLPGPVSQKIWKNVVDAQQSNLTESAQLAH